MNIDTAATSTGTAEPDARRALVEQTIILIETHGEPAVKVEAVARQAGVPVTSIYQWFDGRAELIEAAQSLRHSRVWARTVPNDVADLHAIVLEAQSSPEFTTEALALITRILSDERAPLRLTQFQLVGGAVGTAGAQEAMATVHRDGLLIADEVFGEAIGRGYVRGDLGGAQAAVWSYVNLLSRVFTEIGDARAWCASTDAVRRDAHRWVMGLPLEHEPIAAPVTRLRTVPTPSTTDQLHPTAARLVDEVIDQLEHRGELRLRLREVARSQGVSESLIHRHFGNREQLLVRAHIERFGRAASPLLSDLHTVATHCTDALEFSTSLRIRIRAEVAPSGAPARLERLSVLGAAEHRPQLIDEIARVMLNEAAVVGDALTVAADRGWISAATDPRAIGMWLTSLIAAQACFELGDTGFDLDAWTQTLTAFLEVLLDLPPTEAAP